MTGGNAKTLAGVLRAQREALGLSARGLARDTELNLSSIVRFESGERRPSPEVVRRLAKVLKLNAEELLALTNDDLPRFAPYLRAKYDLSDDAIAELEAHFKEVSKQRQPKKRSRA